MAGVMMLPAVALLGWTVKASASGPVPPPPPPPIASPRSEEHTSELQSQSNLVCRLLLEKKQETPYDVFTRCNDMLVYAHGLDATHHTQPAGANSGRAV